MLGIWLTGRTLAWHAWSAGSSLHHCLHLSSAPPLPQNFPQTLRAGKIAQCARQTNLYLISRIHIKVARTKSTKLSSDPICTHDTHVSMQVTLTLITIRHFYVKTILLQQQQGTTWNLGSSSVWGPQQHAEMTPPTGLAQVLGKWKVNMCTLAGRTIERGETQ